MPDVLELNPDATEVCDHVRRDIAGADHPECASSRSVVEESDAGAGQELYEGLPIAPLERVDEVVVGGVVVVDGF